MKPYLAHIKINLKLTLRDRSLLFFNYLFPLVFFFIFAQTFKAQQGGSINQVITMVLIIGVLGSGFFGSGLRAVQERELGILRRYKVAPITAAPILVASLVTGLLAYLPSVALILILAHYIYGMPVPERLFSLLCVLSVGLMAFRGLGLVIASVVNSMQESQMVIQVLYLPMLFLSGATFPVAAMPTWLQLVAQFLPASYLFTSLQGVLVQKDAWWDNLGSIGAMLATVCIAIFLGIKLFRWEKGEKVRASAKMWLVAAVAPFLILGTYQYYSRDNVVKAKLLYREMRRTRTLLIRGPRIFIGDGKVIEVGAVLVKNGRIEEIYEGTPPDAKELRAEPVEAAGKTLLPGLIDAHVHLVAPGGVFEDMKNFDPDKAVLRALASYLYSGVTAVRSVGDPLATMEKARRVTVGSERLGAELFFCGPMFTAEGGHGTEYFKNLPEAIKKFAEAQTVRLPKTPEEARQMVDALAVEKVDGIKAILEAGQAGMVFNRLDVGILKATAEEAKARHLPLSVHTGDAQDVRDALAAAAASIEHGSARAVIPDELFNQMAKQGTAYDPTLAVFEAFDALRDRKTDLLDRSLVQQVGPPELLRGTRKMLDTPEFLERSKPLAALAMSLAISKENLMHAWQAGVTLAVGSDGGNLLVIHGPTVHRELQLWVQAGIPAKVALQAATANAARLLGAGNRIGLIRKGYEATMLLVDGNPLEDIAVTERISMVLFKGERVDRADLFDQD